MMNFLKIPVPSPSWYSGRLWLLRLGYYKLTRQKEIANDWIWIVDHTVQIGVDKCFVILGIRRSSLPPRGNCVSHEDVESICLDPVKESNGKIVWQQLEKAIEKTGIPREIIGDHGSDLAKGIKDFCLQHQETCYIYDIKHKTAAVLKHELENDEKWLKFIGLANKTKVSIQQTILAFLAPPNQRSKSRYMNVDILIKWGLQTLAFVEEESSKAKPDERLLGSSEVIESLFGKLKGIEQDQAKSGFTNLLLSAAAIVSKTTDEVVEKAMKAVRTKEVLDWCKKNIGQSVQSMRKEAFAFYEKTEQKRDQKLGAA
jgi:hypothetical protein